MEDEDRFGEFFAGRAMRNKGSLRARKTFMEIETAVSASRKLQKNRELGLPFPLVSYQSDKRIHKVKDDPPLFTPATMKDQMSREGEKLAGHLGCGAR